MSTRLGRAALLALVVACYLAAAWWPFDFVLPRRVDNGFARDAGVLRFDGDSLAGEESPSWVADAIAARAFRIELEVRTGAAEQTGPARLFSVSPNAYLRDVTIAQESDDLIVRLRRLASLPNGTPPFEVEDVFARPGWRRIAVEVREGSAQVLVDGSVAGTWELAPDALDTWDASYPVTLGNEHTADRGWVGEIRAATVAVPNHATVDYLAVPLDVPGGWWATPPYSVGAVVQPLDVVLNLLGFMPLGALAVVVLPGRRPLWRAALWGLGVSLAMEAGQLFTASRDTSVVDVCVNVAGALLGGWVALRLPVRRRLR